MLLTRLARPFSRKFTTTAVARSEYQQEGIPGANLPFSIANRYKLAVYMALFFCSGFSMPFIVVRHQILKK
ncbi:cytochrome c oxidase subunit 7C, mitochondrial [Patella vulgata]|uniref:cytochrome c oxidase subunit 7C, mitochondrial n=1 Tax=Patella vulgata TaxID=6465 RepID=UPI0021807CF9|nr:cytochrome c oxidase subunit 7C, mitochondrial [Patella vulgata]